VSGYNVIFWFVIRGFVMFMIFFLRYVPAQVIRVMSKVE